MQLITGLLGFIRSIYQNKFMIRSMVVRDMRSRYIGSFLGIFWSILHPLAQLITYYFIFSVVIKIRLGPEYGGTNFAFWLVAGLLPWLFFADVVSRSPSAVLDQSNLITKMVFPSQILPFAHLVAAMVNHLIAVVIYIVFLLLFGYGLSFQVLFILPILLAMSLFALGIAWALSALNVFLRDIGQIVGVFLQIWFFTTPIFYPSHLIPDNLKVLFGLNPMFHVVNGYRAAILGKTDIDPIGLSSLALIALLAFGVGGLIFRKLKPAFADVL